MKNDELLRERLQQYYSDAELVDNKTALKLYRGFRRWAGYMGYSKQEINLAIVKRVAPLSRIGRAAGVEQGNKG